jgi:hypothetical protein
MKVWACEIELTTNAIKELLGVITQRLQRIRA